MVERERAVADALVDLLIATVHRIPFVVRVLPVWVCPSSARGDICHVGVVRPRRPGGRRGRDLVEPIYPYTG
ncbi:hypothetical protein GCM10023334_111020 [Nonomuraea thailandensis]